MLKFTANHEIWLAGEKYDGGENVVEKPSAELLKHAGSAHHAGVIDVAEGLEDSHIESQEDSEKKLSAVMGEWVAPHRLGDGTLRAGYWSGPWGKANRELAEIVGTPRGIAEIAVDSE